jgi:cAMP-specific phosphodiesterase 4
VLATDFGAHFDVISEWRTLIDMKAVVGSEAPLEGDERLLAIKMAMKTADLGYLTKGKELVLTWTERVLAEFFAQGELEKQRGLPVSFGCDRETTPLPESQLGFYNFMVQPLYEAMALVVPMDKQLANLEEMRQYWQAEAEKAKAGKTKAAEEAA